MPGDQIAANRFRLKIDHAAHPRWKAFPLRSPGAQAIAAKHVALGGAAGLLGSPTTTAARTPNRQGWYQHFAGGSIYWSQATGAHEVHGAIREKYASMGWETSLLGFPTSDESQGGGLGRFSSFQGGQILWSPATPAHEVHGDILGKYLSLGASRSFLGYPVSDELPFGAAGARVSNFQLGQIAWSPQLGAAVSATWFQKPQGGDGPGLKPQGLGGPDGMTPEVRRRIVCSAHMELTDDENWPQNDEHGKADKTNELVLTSLGLPQDALTMRKGVGGELRVELTMTGSLQSSGDVRVDGEALLYEGTSETSNDLDGTLNFNMLIPRDGITTKTVTVVNQDEGGDKGVITVTVSNFAV